MLGVGNRRTQGLVDIMIEGERSRWNIELEEVSMGGVKSRWTQGHTDLMIVEVGSR